MSGSFSNTIAAVITLVMLAIERSLAAFHAQADPARDAA
jgi:hypothetical protein